MSRLPASMARVIEERWPLRRRQSEPGPTGLPCRPVRYAPDGMAVIVMRVSQREPWRRTCRTYKLDRVWSQTIHRTSETVYHVLLWPEGWPEPYADSSWPTRAEALKEAQRVWSQACAAAVPAAERD